MRVTGAIGLLERWAADRADARAFMLGWRSIYGEPWVLGLERQRLDGEEWRPEYNPEGDAYYAGPLGYGYAEFPRFQVGDSGWQEVRSVVRDVLQKYGQVGTMLQKGEPEHVADFICRPGLLSWLGYYVGDYLAGAYGGFWRRPHQWVRRFYGIVDDVWTWPEHLEAERTIHQFLWDRGMREALIHLPDGTPNLAARIEQGWAPSHLTYVTPAVGRPFVWLRRAFEVRP